MSANALPLRFDQSDWRVRDPGTGKALPVTRGRAAVAIVTGASGETNTLGNPIKAHQSLLLYCQSHGGGNRVVTAARAYDEAGGTALTFTASGQFALLVSVESAAGTYCWRVAAYDGVTGPTVAMASLIVTSLTAANLTLGATAITATGAQLNAAAAFNDGMGAVTAAFTGHGAGAIGTGVAPSSRRYTLNGTIITEIKVDLEGLASVATGDDVIGLSAGGAAFIGRNVVADNGIIYKIELICLETPTGGDNDVNVVANASAALAYDGAGGTAYGVNGGDAVAGQVVEDLVQGLTANHYFYLTAGTGDTAAAYTAGQFLIRLHGHPVLT